MTMPMPALLWRLVLVLALGVAVGCAGMENPVVEEDDPEPIEDVVDERCEEAEEELVEAISEELAVDAKLEEAHTVESEEEAVTFVAAELVGVARPDEPPIGIWAVRGDLGADEREILAVNAIAREHSEWPFEEDITEEVDGGEEAHECVDAQ
ncbi:MAG TPA: hypothetical protein VM287_15085 [Egibacteraceae bacterium]|nr:hypothetical protein [Egibacteraceae bacterium]